MASLNQVSIEIQVKGEREATQALKRYSDASDKLNRSVLNAASKIESTTNAWDRANKLYEKGVLNAKALQAAQTQLARELAVLNGYTKTNGALNTQRALAELRAAEATRQAAAAEAQANAERKRAQQSYNQLRATIDQSYAARMRLKQAADTLRAAERQGLITREQAIEQLRQYRNAQNAAAQSSQFAGRSISRAGVITQQAGYQIGDFIVQVQSGTNVFVALGQQATQVAGTLTLLGGKWILIGSVLGVAIPLLTAAAAAFMRTRKEADEAGEEISKYEQRLKSLTESLREYSRAKDLQLKGITGEEETAELNLQRARRELLKMQIDLNSLETDRAYIMIGNQQVEVETLDVKKRQFEIDKKRNEIAVANNLISQLESKLATERSLLFYEESKQIQDKIELLRIASEYGEDSVEYQKEEARQRSISFAQQVSQLDLSEKQKLALIEQYNEYEKISTAMRKTNEDAADIFDTLQRITGIDLEGGFNEAANAVSVMNARLDSTLSKIGGILSAIGSIGFETVAIEAETRALQAGRTQAQARIEGQLAQQRSRLEQSGTPEILIRSAEVGLRTAMEARLTAQQEREAALTDPRRTTRPSMRPMDLGVTTSGGGGGGGGAGVDPAEEFRKAKDAVDQLRASYDEQYATSLKVQEAQQKINKAMELGVYTQEQGKEALDNYIASLEQAESPMQKIANTARDALGDAFMSIVDGTKSAKDAFANMARIILKQAFELLVIKPILDGIFGGITGGGGGGILRLFGFANGGAFNNGNVIPFANGGVVSSPTMFPMRGAQTGLMGEAGPEAIMPLKRGKNGKLGVVAEGTSQPIVINQSFNFSANGDDSVKRIIAQEAPKIANLTQKQIIEQRQRGGTMKSVFS